jgi:hypothetical protein
MTFVRQIAGYWNVRSPAVIPVRALSGFQGKLAHPPLMRVSQPDGPRIN